MSAYIVSDETITAIVKGISKYCKDYGFKYTYGDEQRIGQILLDENYRSVNYRYDEDSKPPVFKMKKLKEFDDGILYGCLINYEYQACETPDYYGTKAALLIHCCMKEMLRQRIESQFDDIPWGIDE